MKKSISLILCALLLTGSLMTSCASSNDDSSNIANDQTSEAGETTAAEETKEVDPIALRALVDDELPEEDFEGKEFRIVAENDQDWHYFVEESDGDVINDAVYTRNLAVEDRFNTKIVLAKADAYEANGSFMEKAVLAGDDAFDLAAHHIVNAGALAAKSIFMNWYDIPYINFDKPWWAASTIDNLTYHDVALLAIGDLALTSIGRTYCVFFNKVDAESYGIDDVYGIVRNGEWTIDLLSELTKDIYVDVNANSVRDYDDFYGFSSGSASNVGVYLWAFNNPVIIQDASGEFSVGVRTEKVNNIVETLIRVMKENTGTFYDKNYVSKYSSTTGGHTTSRDMFIDGNVIFANGYVDMAIDYFRDIEDDYGIIPYPKWNEAQENYITMADGNHASLAVPKTGSNLDMIGIITEALCAESYKTLVPAYYETALKVKYTRDAESVEILDMLINSRVFDFGYCYDAWKGCSFVLEGLVQNDNPNFESEYAKKENTIIKHYEDVFAVFDEYNA